MSEEFSKVSKTETLLCEELRKLGLNPIPQYSISRMHIDLAFPKEKLAIEVDGPPHHNDPNQIESDRRRDKFLMSNGWAVIRVKANDVYQNSEDVALNLKKQYDQRKEHIRAIKTKSSISLLKNSKIKAIIFILVAAFYLSLLYGPFIIIFCVIFILFLKKIKVI